MVFVVLNITSLVLAYLYYFDMFIKVKNLLPNYNLSRSKLDLRKYVIDVLVNPTKGALKS